MEQKGTLKLPGWTLGWNLKIGFKKREGTRVLGVTNKVGHFYVPFLDYDTTEQMIVETDIHSLQDEYLLGDAFLFQTGRGFHVIFLDILTSNEWLTILEAANCDEEYKRVPVTNGAHVWVLRMTPKKNNPVIYLKTMRGYLGRNLSRPHYDYLIRRGVPLTELERIRIYTAKKEESLIYSTYEA